LDFASHIESAPEVSRALESDEPFEAAVRAFHIGNEPPKVTHLIAADARLGSAAVKPESPT
jgi:hypothetical protein